MSVEVRRAPIALGMRAEMKRRRLFETEFSSPHFSCIVEAILQEEEDTQ